MQNIFWNKYVIFDSQLLISGLLGGEGHLQGQSGSYDRIGYELGMAPCPSTKVLLIRLGTLLFFLAILAAGILIRLFVKVRILLLHQARFLDLKSQL